MFLKLNEKLFMFDEFKDVKKLFNYSNEVSEGWFFFLLRNEFFVVDDYLGDEFLVVDYFENNFNFIFVDCIK